MQNACRFQLYLPTFSQSSKINHKQILCNDLVNWIQNHGGGWSTESYADMQEKEFIISLSETIWYIDMRHHKKFEERSYHIQSDLFIITKYVALLSGNCIKV